MLSKIALFGREKAGRVLRHLDDFIGRSINRKIFFHDSGLWFVKRLRDKRLKDITLKEFVFPRTVQIEISTLCNADCIGCWLQGIKRPRAIMNKMLYEKIVEESSCYNSTIVLSWIGEPTLDPDLVNKIKLAKGYGIKRVELATNGSLMNERLSSGMIEAGLDGIHFSLDGLTKGTFESIRKNLDFNIVAANIGSFIRLRNKLGSKKPRININFRRMKQNIHEWDEFRREWGPRVDSISSWVLSENQSEYYPFSKREKYYNRRLPCFRLWERAPIYVNGLVGLCCAFAKEEIIMGDISKQSLREIWNSDPFTKYRKLHSELRFSEAPVCNKCNLWKFPAFGYFPHDHPWYV